MRKLFTLFLLLSSTLSLFAWVNVNGFGYELDDQKASVREGYNKYSGNVIIPATFIYNQKTYYVTGIEDDAFKNCTSLTSVTLPNSITYIGEDAFFGCTALTSLTIPESVTSIGEDAFSGCTGLTSLTIPESVTSIGRDAFSGIKNVVYHGSASGSPWSAVCVNGFVEGNLIYSDATKTKLCGCLYTVTGDIVIPNSVTIIGHKAFKGCTGITSVFIPYLLTSIGESAFSGCTGLTSVFIPNSVSYIGYDAFNGVKNVIYHGSSSYWSPWGAVSVNGFVDGYLIYSDEKKTKIRCCSSAAKGDIIIPNTVTRIDDGTFTNNKKITSVTLPNSVTSIGEDVFVGCSSSMVIHVPAETLEQFKIMYALRNYKIVGDAESQLINAKEPPLLVFVDGSMQFIEQSSNNTINAGEQCKILFQITNKGKGTAVGCEATIMGTGSIDGLTFKNIKLPTIDVNATYTVEIPITADMNTVDGTATFIIEITEPNGLGIDPMTFAISTRSFDAPMLKIVDYIVSSDTVQKKQPFALQLLLQNIKSGQADDVDVTISVPSGVLFFDGEEKIHYHSLAGGEQKQLNYQMAINGKYTASTVPIEIGIKEKYGKYAENKTITLVVASSESSTTTFSLEGTNNIPQNEIVIGSLDHNAVAAAPVTATYIQSIAVKEPFAAVPASSVLASYHNEFAGFEIPKRDVSFPYVLFRVKLTGDRNKVRLAKQTLLLHLGQAFQTEKVVTSYENQILFLISTGARVVYLTCGDGCEQQLIYSGPLESNMIYEGTVEVK